jgi:imidazolonepropionase
MTTTLLTNIGLLATHNDELEELPRAAVVLDGEQIAWVGSAASAPDADERVDLDGRAMIPGFVDSHAHLVFSGDRAAEFAARMSGQAYAAGGIRTTVAATRQASDETLRANVARLSAEMLAAGITTFECKSGYGLDVPTEERALRIAGEFTSETTYLGAHVVPAEMERDAYVDLVCGEMLTAAVPHARWIDVFCEKGAFDGDETRRILEVGLAQGLIPRVHANQLTEGPGVQLAVELGAASADHCTHLSDADIDALAGSDTVATLLPLAEFSTRAQYPDARRVIDAGVTVALATDCNPGSAYSTSMPLAIALAVRDMHMTPAEAVHAATALGAQALRRDDVGVIAVGKRADVVVLDASSYVHLAYRPGVPLISQVWQSGRRIGLA